MEKITAQGGWKIDRDYLDLADVIGPGFNRVGTCSVGWRDEMKNDPEAVRFRLLDDDGEVYFGGWLVEGEDEDGDQYGPMLWDFGAADAGSVNLEIRNDDGAWEGYIS